MAEAEKKPGRPTRKVTLSRSWTGDTYLQLNGTERGLRNLKNAVIADIGANCTQTLKLNALDVYVKPDENRAYYVARADGMDEQINGSIAF